MDLDKINANIHPVKEIPQGDSGPAWAPVTGVQEDIGPSVIGDVKFGPVSLQLTGKSVQDVEVAKTILGIFAGALSGKEFSPASALEVVAK